jgi:ribonuclease-3
MVRHSLADITGYSFVNADLLRQALTHRSYGVPHNERLEFLGDGVLNCVVAAVLFERFPLLPEGELSRLRASLVNQQSLFEIAQQIDLGAQLLLGEGELKSGGAQRPSILADALEALIGATFLDGGFAAAHAMVGRLFQRQLTDADSQTVGKDPKTLLQEFLQGRRIALPQYSVISTAGEAHEQSFRVECAIPELKIRTQGEGNSRRGAEQIAARRAYDLGIQSK